MPCALPFTWWTSIEQISGGVYKYKLYTWNVSKLTLIYKVQCVIFCILPVSVSHQSGYRSDFFSFHLLLWFAVGQTELPGFDAWACHAGSLPVHSSMCQGLGSGLHGSPSAFLSVSVIKILDHIIYTSSHKVPVCRR